MKIFTALIFAVLASFIPWYLFCVFGWSFISWSTPIFNLSTWKIGARLFFFIVLIFLFLAAFGVAIDD